MFLFKKKTEMATAETALPGRPDPIPTAEAHFLSGRPLTLDVPEGMGLIIRTAGAARTKQEIKRDFEYLLRLWESVRDLTLRSTAPSHIQLGTRDRPRLGFHIKRGIIVKRDGGGGKRTTNQGKREKVGMGRGVEP